MSESTQAIVPTVAPTQAPVSAHSGAHGKDTIHAPAARSPRAPRKAKAPVVTSYTTATLAVACKAPSAKDFRRWLRAFLDANGASDAKAGKGGRYAFTQAQGALIVKAYGERKAQHASGAAGATFERLAKAGAKAPRKV